MTVSPRNETEGGREERGEMCVRQQVRERGPRGLTNSSLTRITSLRSRVGGGRFSPLKQLAGKCALRVTGELRFARILHAAHANQRRGSFLRFLEVPLCDTTRKAAFCANFHL